MKVLDIVFFDAIHYKVRDDLRKAILIAAYMCLGVELSGRKDLPGLRVREAQKKRFLLRWSLSSLIRQLPDEGWLWRTNVSEIVRGFKYAGPPQRTGIYD